MLLIFALFLFSFVQQIIAVQGQNFKYGYDDDHPEKFYVTHEAWFNITVKESKISSAPIRRERIVIGLFGDICPMTVTNFITITKGLRRATVRMEDYT
jgi:hypothetical protein